MSSEQSKAQPHLNIRFEGLAADQPLTLGQRIPLAVWVGAPTGNRSEPLQFTLPDDDTPVAFTVRLHAVPDDWTVKVAEPTMIVTPPGTTTQEAEFIVTAQRPGRITLFVTVEHADTGATVQHLALPVQVAAPDGQPPPPAARERVEVNFPLEDITRPDVTLTLRPGDDVESFLVIVGAEMSGQKILATYRVPISLEEIQTAALRLRHELTEIVFYPGRYSGQPHPFASLDTLTVDETLAREAAVPLADVGQHVWHLLFKSPRAPAELRQFAADLRNLPHGSTVQIVLYSQRFIIPWTLLYDKPGPITVDTLDWTGFWGYRYRLEVIPPRRYPEPTIREVPPGMLALFNDDPDLRHFTTAQERAIREMQGISVQSVWGDAAVRQVFREPGSVSLLYSYCLGVHASRSVKATALANESALSFNTDTQMRLADLRMLPAAYFAQRPLVFLNTCAGAATQDAFYYDGFMPYFIDELGARGFIGTEVPAPLLLAHDVSLRFMEKFTAGKPVGEILWQLRRHYIDKHTNILAFIYSLYGSGDIRLAVSTEQSNSLTEEKKVYHCLVTATPSRVTVAQSVAFQVELVPVADEEHDGAIELPPDLTDLHCFISAEGLSVVGSEVVTMPIDPGTGHPVRANFELQARLVGTWPYRIDLFVEDVVKGKLTIKQYTGEITVDTPQLHEEYPPILPSIDMQVAPQPDLILQVRTTALDGNSESRYLTYSVTSRLPQLRCENLSVGAVRLSTADLSRIHRLVQQARQFAANAQPDDVRARMLSVGMYLFDTLFPVDEAADFRTAFWQAVDKIATWLIVEDGITWLPWELVVPYHDVENGPLTFLSERFNLTRWIDGLGVEPYAEIPVGEIALSRYNSVDRQQDADEEAISWRRTLQAVEAFGISKVFQPETPFYALHLLQQLDHSDKQRDIVVRQEADAVKSLDEEAAKARLDLRLKRPIITLGTTTKRDISETEDEWVLSERVTPFLRSGASAVIGSSWPTSDTADQIFWSTVYNLLERRVPFGEIIRYARRIAKQAAPDQLDWLAYTAFGDPRARAYFPEESEGYTALECLNPDDPLRPGKTYYFRASIRSRPPIWYRERLRQVEALPEDPCVVFLSPALDLTDPEPIKMTPLGRMMVQATIRITPQEEGEYPLTTTLFDGEERLQVLYLTLKVEQK